MSIVQKRQPKRADSFSQQNLERVKDNMEKPKIRKCSFNMEEPLHRSFKAKAAGEGKEMVDILLAAVKKYVDE